MMEVSYHPIYHSLNSAAGATAVCVSSDQVSYVRTLVIAG